MKPVTTGISPCCTSGGRRAVVLALVSSISGSAPPNCSVVTISSVASMALDPRP
jgi:hypothetical protein